MFAREAPILNTFTIANGNPKTGDAVVPLTIDVDPKDATSVQYRLAETPEKAHGGNCPWPRAARPRCGMPSALAMV